MAFLVNNTTLPWILTLLGLVLIMFFMGLTLFLTFFLTHAGVELKARVRGRPIGIFFDDSRGIEFRAAEAQSGLITDPKYGTYIQNEKGSYIDRVKTKLVYLPFCSNVAMGANARMFKMTDDLTKILKDEKLIDEIRQGLATGDINPKDLEPFEGLRESVNFSNLKSFMNAIIPHNISSMIEMKVAQRLQSYGKGQTNQIMWFVIIGIALIALAGLVLYMVLPHGGGGTTTIIQQAPQALANATVSRIVG